MSSSEIEIQNNNSLSADIADNNSIVQPAEEVNAENANDNSNSEEGHAAELKPTGASSPNREANVEAENGPPAQPNSPPSPDSNCPICLGKMENKSFTNSCFHQFCFTCLLEWSKVKPQCPLCKQPFKSIVHSVRSMEDYDQYHLTLENTRNAATSLAGTRRYRRSTRRAEFLERYESSLARAEAASHRDHTSNIIPSRFVSDYRRHIYESNHWVQPVNRNEGVRRTDTAFYAANPAMTHRLVPWLNRELNALGCGSRVAFVIDLIVSMLERYHIHSPEFAMHISPYVHTFTRHFVHEFYNFARSPYDMVGYDRTATYPTTTPYGTYDINNSTNNSSSGSDDSDLEVVSVLEGNRSGRPPWSVPRSVIVNRARSFLESLSFDPNYPATISHPPLPPQPHSANQSITLSPQPGPSGVSNASSSSLIVDGEFDAAGNCVVAVKHEPNADDIIVLDPPARRSPEIITLTDEDEPEAATPEENEARAGPSSAGKRTLFISSDTESLNTSSASSADVSGSSSGHRQKRKHTKRKKSSRSKRPTTSETDNEQQNERAHKRRKATRRHHKHGHKSKSKRSKNNEK